MGGSSVLAESPDETPKAFARGRAKRVCGRKGEGRNPIENLEWQLSKKRAVTVRLTAFQAWILQHLNPRWTSLAIEMLFDSDKTSKGHRGLNDIWDHFNNLHKPKTIPESESPNFEYDLWSLGAEHLSTYTILRDLTVV